MESLQLLLERPRLNSVLREAEMIRSYPAGDERLEEARKLIRFVLYEFALHKIDAAARDQILDLLQFASECSHVIHEQPVPAYQDEGACRSAQATCVVAEGAWQWSFWS